MDDVLATQLQEKALNLIHTAYYKNFFLLRTEIIVNGQQAQVGINEEGWLTLNCRNPKVGVTFDSLVTDVNEVLQQHGLHGVSNYWCEEVPLFELKGTSQEELEKLLGLEGEIQEQLALKIYTRMKDLLQHSPATDSSPDLHILVHPQLYLLIPDYAHMDGRPIHINKSNFSECMALFGESRLFDFGAVFRAARTNQSKEDTGPDAFYDLTDELCEVVGWYGLGQALRIPEYQLQIINQDHLHNTEMCRTKMLSWWWENAEERKWSTLIQALAKTGSCRLATRIALKYGFSVPQVCSCTMPYVPDVTQAGLVDLIGILVTKLRSDVGNQDQDFAKQDQNFLQAKLERDAALRRIETLEHQLSVSQSKITELTKEKEGTESALKLRMFELELVLQSTTNQIELQQQSIHQREKEISHLQMRLQSVEDELAKTKSQIPPMKEDWRRASLELQTKSAEMEILRKKRNEMRVSLDMERRILDNYLQQQAAARISHDQYRRELEMQQLHCKEMFGETYGELEALYKNLGRRNPEIEKIRQSISIQTATLEKSPTPPHNISPASFTRNLSPAPRSRSISPAPRSRSISPAPLSRTISPVSPTVRIAELTNETDSGNSIHALKWEKRKVTPQVMVRGAAAVYGYSVLVIGENSDKIHSYCMDRNEWSTLPVACPHTNPGLTFVQNVLTAIGGELKGQSTKRVTSWKNGRWSKEIPSMKYPHSSPSVTNYNGVYVIAAGGAWYNDKSLIEVYSIQSRSWFKVVDLPKPLYGITSTVCKSNYVVMDGHGSTYSMDLVSLLSSVSRSHRWKDLPCLSVLGEATLATISNQVICVCSDGLYQLSEDLVWTKIHDAFSSFSSWSKSIVCCVGQRLVVGEKLLVVGGHNPHSDYGTTEVSVAHYSEIKGV